jgi:DNA-binding protein HU-beta
MPPAKKQPARRAAPSPTAPITRKEVEDAAARFDKALEDAHQALQAMGKGMGKGAKGAYTDVTKALSALRRDAQKTNRGLLKELDKLRSSVTPAKSSARTTSKRTTSKSSARTTSKRTTSKAPARTASKNTASKSTASKRTASKRTAASRSSSSTSKRPAARRSG